MLIEGSQERLPEKAACFAKTLTQMFASAMIGV